MRLHLIAGARPNFIKIAPIIHAIHKAKILGKNIEYRLVHTGQHYDTEMSDTFFQELNIPEPNINLNCGGGTQAEQTAAIMIAYEKELSSNLVDLVIVVGDVNSTMACSIVAKKMNVSVAHVEAGIRSFDLTMPEEINRMVTDSLTDYFFTTSEWAGENLRKIGVYDDKIFFVGNVMIDTLLAHRNRFRKPFVWNELVLKEKEYFVMTLHRPANVDEEEKFKVLLEAIIRDTHDLPIIFPVHPRTQKIINKLIVESKFKTHNLNLIDPLGYLEFNYLVQYAKAVITDSGGITEETTIMKVPCLTLRDNTERPETVSLGTNEIIGTKSEMLKPYLDRLFEGTWKKGDIPPLWDGNAAMRIIDILCNIYSN
jgi:UDP-N-acetylglucosamine 2-epimerase (non-hydrolysing)